MPFGTPLFSACSFYRDLDNTADNIKLYIILLHIKLSCKPKISYHINHWFVPLLNNLLFRDKEVQSKHTPIGYNITSNKSNVTNTPEPGKAETVQLKPTKLKINGTKTLHVDTKPLNATQT